jgi:hypothetical protein
MGGRQSGAGQRRAAHSQDGVPGQLAVYLARAGGGKSMTQDEIIEMANKAYGIDEEGKPFHPSALLHLEIFAKLVAQHEREACAKVCDHMAVRYEDMRGAALESAAESIRLRGQA